jgi:hypothetical protein
MAASLEDDDSSASPRREQWVSDAHSSSAKSSEQSSASDCWDEPYALHVGDTPDDQVGQKRSLKGSRQRARRSGRRQVH